MQEIEELKILLQNQIDALENNQFDFLLYNNGAGGEFLSSLISRYSPSYNFPLNGSYDLYGRFITNIYFLSNIFSDEIKYTGKINVNDLIQLVYAELDCKGKLINKFINFKSDYLILDEHLNKLDKVLIRAHHIDYRYMTSNNTYYIYPDTKYWQKYRYGLCRLKLYKKDCPIEIAKSEFTYSEKQISFTKKIPMSKMFHKGFLENLFNITNDTFHEELIVWHDKNLNLLNAGVVKW